MSAATPEGAETAGWLWGPWSKRGAIAAVATFLIDQAHKLWMLFGLGLKEGERHTVLPFLDIIYVRNTGISYSLFDSATTSWQWTLAGLAMVAAIGLWVWLAKGQHNRIVSWSLGLIIGGAVGNAIDRLWLGGVADFFSLHAFGFYWYVFNIADMAIVAGVIGLLYDSFISSRNDAAKSS